MDRPAAQTMMTTAPGRTYRLGARLTFTVEEARLEAKGPASWTVKLTGKTTYLHDGCQVLGWVTLDGDQMQADINDGRVADITEDGQ